MAVRNTLGDMHNILMEQLERLNDCEPGSDEQRLEIERGSAMAEVAKQVVSNANLMLRAAKETKRIDVPMVLTGKQDGPRALSGKEQ